MIEITTTKIEHNDDATVNLTVTTVVSKCPEGSARSVLDRLNRGIFIQSKECVERPMHKWTPDEEQVVKDAKSVQASYPMYLEKFPQSFRSKTSVERKWYSLHYPGGDGKYSKRPVSLAELWDVKDHSVETHSPSQIDKLVLNTDVKPAGKEVRVKRAYHRKNKVNDDGKTDIQAPPQNDTMGAVPADTTGKVRVIETTKPDPGIERAVERATAGTGIPERPNPHKLKLGDTVKQISGNHMSKNSKGKIIQIKPGAVRIDFKDGRYWLVEKEVEKVDL